MIKNAIPGGEATTDAAKNAPMSKNSAPNTPVNILPISSNIAVNKRHSALKGKTIHFIILPLILKLKNSMNLIDANQ